MLSDSLTKHMDTTDLRKIMSGAAYMLAHTFMPKTKTGVKVEHPHGSHMSPEVS